MKIITLDTAKLLGFRIGQTGSSRTGIKLGNVKEGLTKGATVD